LKTLSNALKPSWVANVLYDQTASTGRIDSAVTTAWQRLGLILRLPAKTIQIHGQGADGKEKEKAGH
jgi:hypothetical protein